MKKLNKIALSVMVVVAVGIGFSGCDIADESKSPLMEIQDNEVFGIIIKMYSQDDETIIKNMSVVGRNGKCDIKDLGVGGEMNFLFVSIPLLKYGEKLTYNTARTATFDKKNCPPKNGKYEIELNTNFGTYHYEMATTQ